MFKKYAALHWIWFWFASAVIYMLISRFMPTYYESLGIESTILGNYFWAGLLVIFITWIVGNIIKRVKKIKQNSPS